MSQDKRAALLKAFRLQAQWCREYGSPFTGALIDRLADDIESHGPVDALVGDWPGAPLADAVSLRLCGALHAAALSNRDPALAAQYPAARPDWSMDAVWPVARVFLSREADWARAFIDNAPQTNETRRTIALLPGFLIAAGQGPLHLLEIGASAGLNLHWDRFRFETQSWSCGPPEGPRIETDWQAPIPAGLGAAIAVASRAGCDVNPLDVSDPDQRIRLISYVWPDQPERLARINRAIEIALRSGLRPERADAGDFLQRRLAGPLPEGTTVVFHSVVWQYLPEPTKAAVQAALEAAAAHATPNRRLAWLRYEPDAFGPGQALPKDSPGFTISLTVWPGGQTEPLVLTDGHTRRVVSIS